jgi:hypothetical protein
LECGCRPDEIYKVKKQDVDGYRFYPDLIGEDRRGPSPYSVDGEG